MEHRTKEQKIEMKKINDQNREYESEMEEIKAQSEIGNRNVQKNREERKTAKMKVQQK